MKVRKTAVTNDQEIVGRFDWKGRKKLRASGTSFQNGKTVFKQSLYRLILYLPFLPQHVSFDNVCSSEFFELLNSIDS